MLVAGCGGHGRETAPVVPHPAPMTHPEPQPRPPGVKLKLTIVDGDRNARIAGATVRVWGRSGRTSRDGVAEIRVPRLRPLAVTIRARGYATRVVRERFGSRRATIRVYDPSSQWPLYGATPSRTQAQAHIRLRPPFRTVWTRGMGSLIEFPAVVADGVAYIGNARATVRAISMRFGKVIWRRDTRGGKMASSPAVVGDTLVYHTMNGWVIVLDRSTGRVRWRWYVGSPVESSPVVRHGVDYFGAWNGRLYALDLRRHRLRWTRWLGAKITSSAALSGDTLFIGDYGGRLWALRAATGRTRWVGGVDGRIYGTPAVAARRVFVPSSTGGSVTAFSTRGRYLWRVSTGAYVYSSPATWGGRVFFGSYNGVFYGVSAASGRVLWRVGAGGPISGAAVVVDGVAYAGSFAHQVVGVGARSGRVLLRFRHGYYVPVSGNGMRLLFHGYSRLYAVEPRPSVRR